MLSEVINGIKAILEEMYPQIEVEKSRNIGRVTQSKFCIDLESSELKDLGALGRSNLVTIAIVYAHVSRGYGDSGGDKFEIYDELVSKFSSRYLTIAEKRCKVVSIRGWSEKSSDEAYSSMTKSDSISINVTLEFTEENEDKEEEYEMIQNINLKKQGV